jgi:HEAT repeat protein
MMNGDPTIDDYIQWLNDPNPDIRRNAAWVLGRQRDVSIVEPLIAVIHDPDPTVRLRVVEALGNLKDERIVEPLIAALTREPAGDVRAAVASALGRSVDLRAVEPLIAALKDPLAPVRAAAAEGLGALHDPQGAASLVATLLDDDDADVGYYAAKSLIQIGGASIVDLLLPELSRDHPPEIVVQIIEILGQLYDRRAVEPLKLLVDHADEGIRETAKWALRTLGQG